MRGDPQCCQGFLASPGGDPRGRFPPRRNAYPRSARSGRATTLLPGFWPEDGQEAVAVDATPRRLPSRYGSANPRQTRGIDPSPARSAAAGTRLAFASAVARLDGPRSGRCGRSWRAWPWRCSRGRAEGISRARRPRRSQASRSFRCSPPRGRLRWPGRVPPIVPGARRPSAPSCRSPRPRPWPASTCGSTAGRETAAASIRSTTRRRTASPSSADSRPRWASTRPRSSARRPSRSTASTPASAPATPSCTQGSWSVSLTFVE